MNLYVMHMSKFAHYHLAANDDACLRLIKMGEVPDHVFNVGCPSIDAILKVSNNPKVITKYNLEKPYFILIQHPVTSEIKKSSNQIKVTLEAIKLSGINVLIILPNNDAGYSSIVEEIKTSKCKMR